MQKIRNKVCILKYSISVYAETFAKKLQLRYEGKTFFVFSYQLHRIQEEILHPNRRPAFLNLNLDNF